MYVCIKNRATFQMTRGTADGLDERIRGAKEPLFVGIKNRDQGNFRKIQPFTQQIDPNQNIKLTSTKTAEYLDALQCFDFRMKVPTSHTNLGVILRKVFCHAFRQCRNQHTLILFGAKPNFVKQIVDLSAHRTYFNGRIG